MPLLRQLNVHTPICDRILSLGTPQVYARGHLFFETTHKPAPLLFIKKGVVRNFYRPDEVETTHWISAEGEFSCTQSFFSHSLGCTSLEVLEAAEVIEIRRETLDMAYRDDPSLEQFGRLLAEYYVRILARNYRMLGTKSAAERYHLFCRWYPHLDGRVALKHIATLLHLDQATLSRVRGKKQRSAQMNAVYEAG